MTKKVSKAAEEVQERVFSVYDAYETDSGAEEDGKWFDMQGGIRVKVRRFTSKVAQENRVKLEAPYLRTHRSGKIPEKVSESITIRQLAETILVDWEGLANREGELIEFDVEVAHKILLELPNFRNEIAQLSLVMDNYRIEDAEEAEKN